MPSVRLPVLSLNLPSQRYSCHGCGNCCRDFTVQLRAEDLRKLEAQRWEENLGEPVTVAFGGERFLRQREDGSCIFLMENGLCRIHAEYGFEQKPIACQLFPFHFVPTHRGIKAGLNFACQSVLENKGASLESHCTELGRMAGELEELRGDRRPPLLTDKIRASEGEVNAVINRFEGWLRRSDIDLPTKLGGMSWVVGSLNQARLENVRNERFGELLDVLFGALPEELAYHPLSPPSRGQRKMLRRAVFTRTEDPKISRIEKVGRWRIMLGQLWRGRRFASGRGSVPRIGIGWPDDVPMAAVEQVEPATTGQDGPAIADLVTRYLRASILAEDTWGAGYYRWPIVAGLQALLLNVAAAAWLARVHAVGRDADELGIEDVRAALGRIDRTAGRARWLGSRAERWRLRYLAVDDGMRRLLAEYALVEERDDERDERVASD